MTAQVCATAAILRFSCLFSECGTRANAPHPSARHRFRYAYIYAFACVRCPLLRVRPAFDRCGILNHLTDAPCGRAAFSHTLTYRRPGAAPAGQSLAKHYAPLVFRGYLLPVLQLLLRANMQQRFKCKTAKQ